MPDDIDRETLAQEVTSIYVGVMRALEGASTAAAQSALAMAMLMTGEHLGLEGKDLADWIDETANDAKAVLAQGRRRPPVG
ncbi:MAG: hypothetical protein HY834_14725 [Devosia nanyangense]|uniref:Uncharacterized protein n=1 Tax=Devosia nanyangense TaxID=1228055 RepID=A0A933L3K4_9HYPH|nr:hypothetical protein [Devosia nanyangense]